MSTFFTVKKNDNLRMEIEVPNNDAYDFYSKINNLLLTTNKSRYDIVVNIANEFDFEMTDVDDIDDY